MGLTFHMQREFHEIFDAEKGERGIISAKAYALGVMLQKRRDDLAERVTWLGPYNNPDADFVRDTLRVNAELTLIMIERGA